MAREQLKDPLLLRRLVGAAIRCPLCFRSFVSGYARHQGTDFCLATAKSHELRVAGYTQVSRTPFMADLIGELKLPFVVGKTATMIDMSQPTVYRQTVALPRVWLPVAVVEAVDFVQRRRFDVVERVDAITMLIADPRLLDALRADEMLCAEQDGGVLTSAGNSTRKVVRDLMAAKKKAAGTPGISRFQDVKGDLAPIATLKLSDLRLRYATQDENPNKMDPEKFDLLVESIKTNGFLQPILVLPLSDGAYIVEDGHHRFWAAEKAKLTHLTASVKHMEADRARLLGVGMNMLRGEVDLGAAAALINEVQETLKLPLPEVSSLTGFTASELDALMSKFSTPEEILDEGAEDITIEDESTPDVTFTLEVEFKNREHLKMARKRLKKIGKGDIAQGLLALLGEQEESA